MAMTIVEKSGGQYHVLQTDSRSRSPPSEVDRSYLSQSQPSEVDRRPSIQSAVSLFQSIQRLRPSIWSSSKLQGTEHSVYLDLLRLFAHGTWSDYKSNASHLLQLVPDQILMLKQLTVLTLAEIDKMDELVHKAKLYKTNWHFLYFGRIIYFCIDVYEKY
ncbi:hypothetical protein CsSME_00000966 [Camellia sinensis var. sinensis]